MDRFITMILASVAVACICMGYRLFCYLPATNGVRPEQNIPAVIIKNVLPGALLALFGTGLLMAEARGFIGTGLARQRHQPAAEGSSWHHPMPSRLSRAA